MSYNITVEVSTGPDGKKDATVSGGYFDNAEDGTYTVSGHHCGPEGGSEFVQVRTPGGLNVNGGHLVQPSDQKAAQA